MLGIARNLALLVGRILIAAVFIYDGALLVSDGKDAGIRLLESAGLPDWTWGFAIALELGGGLLVVIGLFTRGVAVLLALFCVSTALLFHNHLAVSEEVQQFGKDFGLAGGFLFLVVAGAGAFSLDARPGK